MKDMYSVKDAFLSRSKGVIFEIFIGILHFVKPLGNGPEIMDSLLK